MQSREQCGLLGRRRSFKIKLNIRRIVCPHLAIQDPELKKFTFFGKHLLGTAFVIAVLAQELCKE